MKSHYGPPRLSQKEAEAVYRFVADDVTCNAIAAVLTVLHMRKWHKDQISKLYDDVIGILDQPPILGKNLMSEDVKEFLTKKYGIDWSRVHIRLESEEKRCK